MKKKSQQYTKSVGNSAASIPWKFAKWVGQQNIFLVFFVCFLLIPGAFKILGGARALFAQDVEDRTQKAVDQKFEEIKPAKNLNYKVNTTPTPKPSPTHEPLPSTSPSLYPTPNIDPDPMIECQILDECGGGSKLMKRSECSNSVCCLVQPNQYESLTMEECYKRKSEYFSERKDELSKSYPSFIPYTQPTYIQPTYTPQVVSSSSQLTDEQIKIKKDLLQAEIDICKADAISTKNQSLKKCYMSPEGSWQDRCISDAMSKYESSLEICVYQYELGILELEK